MKLNPRWVKILNDIWGNKSRSLLVILSIAVGVAVVGMINNARVMISRDLNAEYQLGTPTHVQMYISPFPKELASAVESLPSVAAAQPRRLYGSDAMLPDGTLEDISLSVLPDYGDIRVARYQPEQGKAVPGLREVLIERQAAEILGLQIGDPLVIQLNDEAKYTLTIAGFVHDIYEFPYGISRNMTGYVSMSTLQWMGQPAYYNRLDIVTTGTDMSREAVLEVAAQARDIKIESQGYIVGSFVIPGTGNSNPGQHWAEAQIQGFVLILQIMSVMSIFLSGGLVVNTITAILNQQVRQIGIMRSVGAVRQQVTVMYLFNVFIFSLAGLLISLPVGLFGSYYLADFAAGFLNFDLVSVGFFPSVFLMMALISIIVPQLVAIVPILSGVAISVYDAIYQFGQIKEGGSGRIEKTLYKLKSISPPVMMSLQNTFRNIPRLAFTLITLTMAGATFVAVFSTRASLNAQVNELVRYTHFDAAIGLPRGTNLYTAQREAMRIPGVAVAEGWASQRGVVIDPFGREGEQLNLVGLPHNTVTMEPKIMRGRWLMETDTWQVVVNEDLLEVVPGLEVGDSLDIKIGELTRTYQVVGVMPRQVTGPRVYINYSMFTKITNRHNQADELRIRTSLTSMADDATQDALGALLEDRFSNAGISNDSASVRHRVFSFFAEPFSIILVVLVIMAALLAVVGSLSLTGTMGINVMERTREIGVLRAVGATNQAVRKVVVVEGIAIALVSWLLVVLLSPSSSAALAGAVIYTVMRTALVYRFSFTGLFMWLVIVIGIGVLSSLAPARRAVSLTVREVLDYE